jgi:methionyl-tRNA synthetase
MNLFTDPRPRRRYLFIPATPTPNGPLHLGHLAGPYLRMDVLARHRRSRGDDARMISGTDPYESYVELVAERERRPPDVVARKYFAQIADDLAAARIEMNLFFDPIDATWSRRYLGWVSGVLEDLVSTGVAHLRRESVLYSLSRGRHLVGCWLIGQCPICSAAARGFFCEECGAHFSPSSIRAPSGSREDGVVEWRTVDSLFAAAPDRATLAASLEHMKLPPELDSVVASYFQHEGAVVRLTHPGTWGIPWTASGHVVFSYPALYAYALLCGEIWAEREGTGVNAFSLESDVITVRSFGIDAAVPILVGVIGLAIMHGRYRPFDHLLPNYFYYLDRAKFSTSRRHAIFVRDAVDGQGVTSDGMRYYLALTNPQKDPTAMTVADLVDTINRDLAYGIGPHIRRAAEDLPSTQPAPAPGLLAALENLVRKQDRYFDLASMSLAEGARVPIEWAHIGREVIGEPGSNYWWLKGLALLAAPVMPDVAGAIWRRLGHFAQPKVHEFLEPRRPSPAVAVPAFAPVDRAILARRLLPGASESAA